MSRRDDNLWIEAEAARVLRDHSIDRLPVDLLQIAEKVGMLVQAMSNSSGGVSGMLLRRGNEFAIMYATHIRNDGFQRFSIAHELGHYFLPGHPERVLGISDIHISDAGFVSPDNFELQADQFAASLLMPSTLVGTVMRGMTTSLHAVDTLASKCRVSLTATAIRYSELTEDAAAAIVTNGQTIDYCFMSDALRRVGGLDWLRKGHPVPRCTATYKFNQDQSNVEQAKRAENTVSLLDWFGGTRDLEMSEEIVGLGSYGKTLTFLTLGDTGGASDPDEDDEEGDLEESWIPRFRR